jgi:serine/threonine protein kinase
LISKLLKIDPKCRIPISEITEHPWFKSIPQIREVSTHVQPSTSNKLLENEV